VVAWDRGCGWVTMVVIWVPMLGNGGRGGWVTMVVAGFRWVWFGFLEWV